MLDIKLLRNNFEEVKQALATRNEDFNLDDFQVLDSKRRELLSEVEGLKSRQNKVSKQIPAMKKAGEDTAPIFKDSQLLTPLHPLR